MRQVLYLGIILVLGIGCRNSAKPKDTYRKYEVPFETVAVCGTDVPVYNGGFGSSMVYCEIDSTFWLLTDRGPNIDGEISDSKVFPLPDYTPQVGVFRLDNDSLVMVRRIPLYDTTGVAFNGLPNRVDDGCTGEAAYGLDGAVLHNSGRRGIDPEGLAVALDGSFWVSDEYGPWIMHFDSNGKLLEEFSPFNGKLPAHYACRCPNRGMEGLTINRQGTVLYGMMQSPLQCPGDSLSGMSDILLILALDVEQHVCREFVYRLEKKEHVVSEICYLTDSTFLVLERDGKFPDKGRGFKRIYKIDISRATNNGLSGNVREVEKSLFCDILQVIPSYNHDKPEGISVIGNSMLAIVNDDDFGIDASDKKTVFKSKVNKDNKIDHSCIYLIPWPVEP